MVLLRACDKQKFIAIVAGTSAIPNDQRREKKIFTEGLILAMVVERYQMLYFEILVPYIAATLDGFTPQGRKEVHWQRTASSFGGKHLRRGSRPTA